ncbi:class I SAM-dependent methyltransferase [Mucilaginibacter sp.]|uniref:class I SAM-dependent methyltransferase n=1 Tax=Mucilaginibacter sp. TaxID=1882438 RepID=UPI00260B7C9B|nr:class I SAM-dependent methyltransferase [Mucilaginibacter sp.]MDB4925672.1 methyltransferase protein [Mucilaginibacter sp.]
MAANYNNSAWFYDRLSRLIYGRALINAQVYLLQFIPPNSNLLIVGGGTGWILEELTRVYPAGLKITYVEVAANMMTLSKKRNWGNNEVTFINAAAEDTLLPGDFDVIITPFLFDNFTEQTLQKVFDYLHPQLKTGGLWLNTDFQLTGKWWQNILLNTMFVFFKILCGIEASALPAIEKQFSQTKYITIAEKTFFGGFIASRAYQK